VKRLELQKLTIDELVERFAALGLEQDEALLDNDTRKFNRVFAKVEKVEEELKSRTPDQRRALLSLYDHENDQVRLNAANATLAVSPKDARALLEAIAESGVFPQRGDAGMALWALDEGISEPT
jgi:HEAT repeat protein